MKEIKDLYIQKKMSARSYNVCIDNKLFTVTDLKNYYSINKTFSNIRNCGTNSNIELIQICEKYTDENISKQINEINPLEKIILNLNRMQREVINSYIQLNTSSLSARSKNAIIAFLDNNLKIKNFGAKILFSDYFYLNEIKNIGSRSITELEVFVSIIKDFIIEVNQSDDEKYLTSLKNRFFIQSTFSLQKIPNDILESESIFQLTNYLINQNAFYSSMQTAILIRAFKIYQSSIELNLDEIASQLKISRERVRQIKNNVIDELYNKLQFIQNIDDDLLQKYNIDKSQNLIEINDEQIQSINNQNKTDYTREFITFILYSYWSQEFLLIGNYEDVLQPRYFNARNRHNWISFYIIKKELVSEFDFNSFINDISNRLNERIEETYSFHFKSYLNNFVKIKDSSFISLVFPIAERIINQEFELLINLNDDIVFKRNTIKQVPDFAIEALEKLSVPSKIEDIYKLIEKDYPEITKSKEALRGSLQRTPEIIYFGRSSTYGLKKWEIDKEGIKGGTIKDIIFEYLQDKTDPIHILELLNEVHKYREKTNAKNIITNLKLDPQKQFVIFNQSFIGLSGKTYNSHLTFLPKFLGKTITNYIKQKCTNRITLEEYFSIHLKIDQKNMNYIIDYLIEQQFVFIDNQNNLRI